MAEQILSDPTTKSLRHRRIERAATNTRFIYVLIVTDLPSTTQF